MTEKEFQGVDFCGQVPLNYRRRITIFIILALISKNWFRDSKEYALFERMTIVSTVGKAVTIQGWQLAR